MMNEKKQIKTKPPSPEMVQSAIRYFRKEGYKVEQEKTALEGFSGILRTFDLIVQKGRVAQGVWIRDWNRTIGVNLVINIDKASEDVKLSDPIIVGEKFSDHAKSYANRRKITLLQKQKLTVSLR
ncbi:MAG TPA: restriction endonuclease [Candidatus Bathyarchaeia archaeon]|jgi:galactitol-specific phosphotransferase system IIB component|nr:restriction endonuclease [Candidatus Bathyarchaeia archaeon]